MDAVSENPRSNEYRLVMLRADTRWLVRSFAYGAGCRKRLVPLSTRWMPCAIQNPLWPAYRTRLFCRLASEGHDPRYGNARREQAWGTDKSASTKRWPPSTWSAPATLGTLREEIGSTRAGEYRPVAPVPHRRAQIYASPELSKEDGRHAQSPAHEPAGPPRQTT